MSKYFNDRYPFKTAALIFAIVIGSISCDSLSIYETDNESFTIQSLMESSNFNNFVESSINYSQPVTDKLETVDSNFVNSLQADFNIITHDETSALDTNDKIRQLKVLMGYKNKDEHNELLLIVKQSLYELHSEFPRLKNMSYKDKLIFEDALTLAIDERVKDMFRSKNVLLMSNCEADLDYCQGIALSTYLYATAACVASTALSPFVALGCQIGASVIHSAAQYECQKEYSECEA